ncbi:macrophage mannose receptor 1-like [Synchiropus splendidus]|uniref:macrophage mannose receptor 1-like n=1 Tax=Synchiropus splendidus TaxID=270530 RepID=UPI00237EDE8D|nr:macrophage mannose receptor 1-like [Synchiropus splendidus]
MSVSHSEALEHCRSKYADLVSIHDVETVNILADKAKRAQMDDLEVWIGLHKVSHGFTWSLSNDTFYGPGERLFRKWSGAELSILDGLQGCTQMNENGYWTNSICATLQYSVCLNVTHNATEFVFIKDLKNWSKAQIHCRRHYTDLATIRHEDDNRKVREISSNTTVWIGLSSGSWEWLDKSNFTFRFWHHEQNEPDISDIGGICVVADFSQGGKWKDRRCKHQRTFVCYEEPDSLQVIVVQFLTKSLDLNNQTLNVDILKQLTQKVQGGLPGNAALRWKKWLAGKIFFEIKLSSAADLI